MPRADLRSNRIADYYSRGTPTPTNRGYLNLERPRLQPM